MSHTTTCQVAALSLLLFGASSPAVAATGPREIGTRKQLFIDRRFIAASEGVVLAVNPPEKRGAVIEPERPWEMGRLGYGEVILEDQGRYRMWYPSFSQGKNGQLGRSSFCYAESSDGVHWTKPSLGQSRWPGDAYSPASSQTNILAVSPGTVFLAPSAPTADRYKILDMSYWPDPQKAGLRIGTSADGIRWKINPLRLLPFSPDTVNQVFYDTRLRKYVAYVRTWAPLRKVGRIEIESLFEPWPYDKSQKPYLIWGKDKIPVPSHEFHQAISYDAADPPETDLYTPAVHQYAWADDAYFAFPSPYRHFPDPPRGKFGNDGLLDIQLAASRDGVTFDRPDRRPYIPLGLRGGPEGGALYMSIGMLRRGGEIYQYYTAFPYSHGEYVGFKEIRGMSGIYLAVQRLDGFMSADFAYAGGSLTTPPVIFGGRRLELNLNASAMGTLRVELRDAQDKPIPGFKLADCDLVDGNCLAAGVSWRGKSDVSALAGKPVRLHFAGRSLKLYAFQFVD